VTDSIEKQHYYEIKRFVLSSGKPRALYFARKAGENDEHSGAD
jgi:hypothetical protein